MKGIPLGFLFLILTLTYGSARKLISDDDIILTENNELERQLVQESSIPTESPPKSPNSVSIDTSSGGEPTTFSGDQEACGHPSCGGLIPRPNCQNNCPSCGCGQSYPSPQPTYPQPPYPSPQPAYPQPQPPYPSPQPSYPQPPYPSPQPAYPEPPYPSPQPSYPQPPYPSPQPAYPQPPYPSPQPAYPEPQPQPQPTYPPLPSPACQPNYPPQPEPTYPPLPSPACQPNYPPQPEPNYPPWPEPAYPPRPEPTYPPWSEPEPAYPPPMTGPRPIFQIPGTPSNDPSCNIGCRTPGGVVTPSPMTIEDEIETRGSMNEQVVSDIGSPSGSLGGDGDSKLHS